MPEVATAVQEQDRLPQFDAIATVETVQPFYADRIDDLTSEGELQKESIFRYYSPMNEVTFLRKLAEEDPAQSLSTDMNFYYSENVVRFLNEYVGRVPYDDISFLLKGRRLDYAGTDMMRTMEDTAVIAPEGSRERSDYVGMDIMRQAMIDNAGAQDGLTPMVIKLSPAYVGDYSFMFCFTREDLQNGQVKINEKILRYKEPRGTVEVSKQLLDDMTMQPVEYTTANQFLENPLVFHTKNPQEDMAAVLEKLHIDRDLIAHSELFEARVREEIGPWIDTYARKVIYYSTLPRDDQIDRYAKHDLETMLSAIYNRAQEIKRQMASGEVNPDIPRFDREDEAILYYATREEATIEGGGSCPVTAPDEFETVSGTRDGLSTNSIYDGRERRGRCSFCGKYNDGHYHCERPISFSPDGTPQKCTAEYPDETYLDPKNRTKKCRECGGAFGC